MFNVINYLDSTGTPYWLTGKNVSYGWVGIQCPYPGCSDTSNHCGINLNTGIHTCWKCGKKGGPEQLVMLLEHCNYHEAEKKVRRHSTGLAPVRKQKVRNTTGVFTYPKLCTEEIPGPHLRYLKQRNYDPYAVSKAYSLRFCYNVGKYRFRIIIPCFLNGQLVNFTARDITDKSEKKYIMAPNAEALVTGEDLLYNIDTVGHTAVIVEGALDVWRIGPGAVALMGTALTESKLNLLVGRGVKRVFIVYDEDAKERADEVSLQVSKLVRHTEVVYLHGDPDKYFWENPNDLKELHYIMGI